MYNIQRDCTITDRSSLFRVVIRFIAALGQAWSLAVAVAAGAAVAAERLTRER